MSSGFSPKPSKGYSDVEKFDKAEAKASKKIDSDYNKTKIKYNKHARCPKCSGFIFKKDGKYGEFYRCEHFPKCKYTRNTLNLKHWGK